jgi:ribosomal protein S18 acetylase RimI-like enzyme
MPRVSVVRELEAVEIPAAVGVVARGMRDNPLHIAALGADAEARGARLIRLFTVALPMILAKGVVLGAFDGDSLVGVAGMVAPGRCQPSATHKLTVLPRIIPAIGPAGFARVGRWMGTWAQHDLAEPHWHLGPVAVDSHLQGRGIGTLLLSEYCARLDRLNAVGYLETDKPTNVAFYEKFGFQTIGAAPVLNMPNWFMRRAPSAKFQTSNPESTDATTKSRRPRRARIPKRFS